MAGTTIEPDARRSAMQPRFDEIEACLRAMEIPRGLQLARAALDEAEDPVDRAGARYWLARAHYVSGALDVAIVLAAEADAAAAAAGSPLWQALAQTVQARCLEECGESQAALDLVLLALQTLERAGDGIDVQSARQGATVALGVVHLRLGELGLAMDWCQRALDLARTLPDRTAYGAALDTVACVHSALAGAARDAGDAAEAERRERLAIGCTTEAVEVARAAGHADYETTAVLNLAESYTLVGDARRALELLLDWERRHPDPVQRQRAHQLDSLGQAYLALGRHDEAVVTFEHALACSDSDGTRTLVTLHLSQALEACGRWQEALARHKAFHALHVRMSDERAGRSARVAAARLDIERERARARRLASSNDELKRRAADLAHQADTDALTGLPNRRQVDRRLQRPRRPTWVVMIDVDHFKQVNDTFSHAVGDRVLQQVAQLLRANCRPTDLPARLGGEEFVLVLEGESATDAHTAAERTRRAVEAHDWHAFAPGLQVTVSMGVAGTDEAALAADLLALADHRLYAAKRGGRNRVVAGG